MENQKIGITTWYRNGNFGGTLQAVGLLKALEKLGFQAEFTDYCPQEASYAYKIMRKLKNAYLAMFYPRVYKSRQRIFGYIAKELPQSPKFYHCSALAAYANQNYCAAICGSDQIWNSYDGVEPYYFLSYYDGKKIAYAPSIGLNTVKECYRADFQRYVAKIDTLSIREEKGKELILSYTGRTAQVMLDPSMLLTRDEWLQFSNIDDGDTAILAGKYILCYFIGGEGRYLPFVETLSKQLGLPVFYITTRSRNRRINRDVVTCGVRGFIRLIVAAECFLTDSYHGLLFGASMKTKKLGLFRRFADDEPRCQNSRIDQAVSALRLEGCQIADHTAVADFLNARLDERETENRLTACRDRGLEFLRKALTDIS